MSLRDTSCEQVWRRSERTRASTLIAPGSLCSRLIRGFLLIVQRSSSITHQHPSRACHASTTMSINNTHSDCNASSANTLLHKTARAQIPQNPAPPVACVHSADAASASAAAAAASAGLGSLAGGPSERMRVICAQTVPEVALRLHARRHVTHANNNRFVMLGPAFRRVSGVHTTREK